MLGDEGEVLVTLAWPERVRGPRNDQERTGKRFDHDSCRALVARELGLRAERRERDSPLLPIELGHRGLIFQIGRRDPVRVVADRAVANRDVATFRTRSSAHVKHSSDYAS